jgi:hypothetical protein
MRPPTGAPARVPCPDCGKPKSFTSQRCLSCHQKYRREISRRSLSGRAAVDKTLAKKIAEGRKRAHEDYLAMERWARRGGTTTGHSGALAQGAA